MIKNINKVKEVDVSAVAGNKTLAAAVDRRSIERCKEAIERLGIVHTPVIGAAKGGRRMLLSGQCELTALRELGVKKMDAIEVDVAGDEAAGAKLPLLLISLQGRPGALCEGLLLQEAVGAGVSRSEIQAMLGRSASWVSNRLSLVTRLDGNVYEMVRSGLLEPRCAEEISWLPAEAQFKFAEIALREGLPKSAIESLVSGYRDDSCPDVVKAQIINNPREALKRMADKRRAVNPDRPGRQNASVTPEAMEGHVKSMRFQAIALLRMLSGISPDEAEGCNSALKELETSLSALLTVIRDLFTRVKTEVGNSVG